MSLKFDRAKKWLAKRQRPSKREYPLATMAFYGPTDTFATKLAVGLLMEHEPEPIALERWWSDNSDIRHDEQVMVEVVDWMKARNTQRVLVADRLLGCPHEEGIDYPEGENCPDCPFWADRDRFTGERVSESSFPSIDDYPLTYSPHCQVYEHDDTVLEVHIYRGEENGWILEVVNDKGTSIVFNDLFDTDDAAWSEFQKLLREEGIAAFRDEEESMDVSLEEESPP